MISFSPLNFGLLILLITSRSAIPEDIANGSNLNEKYQELLCKIENPQNSRSHSNPFSIEELKTLKELTLSQLKTIYKESNVSHLNEEYKKFICKIENIQREQHHSSWDKDLKTLKELGSSIWKTDSKETNGSNPNEKIQKFICKIENIKTSKSYINPTSTEDLKDLKELALSQWKTVSEESNGINPTEMNHKVICKIANMQTSIANVNFSSVEDLKTLKELSLSLWKTVLKELNANNAKEEIKKFVSEIEKIQTSMANLNISSIEDMKNLKKHTSALTKIILDDGGIATTELLQSKLKDYQTSIVEIDPSTDRNRYSLKSPVLSLLDGISRTEERNLYKKLYAAGLDMEYHTAMKQCQEKGKIFIPKNKGENVLWTQFAIKISREKFISSYAFYPKKLNLERKFIWADGEEHPEYYNMSVSITDASIVHLKSLVWKGCCLAFFSARYFGHSFTSQDIRFSNLIEMGCATSNSTFVICEYF